MTPPNLVTSFMGLPLNSPIIIGACDLNRNPEQVRELALAGAGAVVLPSLFEESVVHAMRLRNEPTQSAEEYLDDVGYDDSNPAIMTDPTEYCDTVAQVKRVTGIPVIASLNGCTRGNWMKIAQDLEEAGADGLEVMLEAQWLDPAATADEVEQALLDEISDMCDQVSIPVAVKLLPYHTNMANFSWRAVEAGASAMIAFAAEPRWHMRFDHLHPTMTWELSPIGKINLSVNGIVRMRSGGAPIDLAACGGISSVEDLLMAVVAGADAVMMTSEIYRSGPVVVTHILEGLATFLARHKIASFDEYKKLRKPPKLYRGMFVRPTDDSEATSQQSTHYPTGNGYGHPLT